MELDAQQGIPNIPPLTARLVCMTQGACSREDWGRAYPIVRIVLIFWLAWMCGFEGDGSFTLLLHGNGEVQ